MWLFTPTDLHRYTATVPSYRLLRERSNVATSRQYWLFIAARLPDVFFGKSSLSWVSLKSITGLGKLGTTTLTVTPILIGPKFRQEFIWTYFLSCLTRQEMVTFVELILYYKFFFIYYICYFAFLPYLSWLAHFNFHLVCLEHLVPMNSSRG